MTPTSQSARLATSADISELARLFLAEAMFEVGMSQGTVTLDQSFDWLGFTRQALARPHSALFVQGDSTNLHGLIYVRAVTQRLTGLMSFLKRLTRRVLIRSRQIGSDNADYAMIDHIYVEPDARRSRIGERLYIAAADWALDQDIAEIHGLVWDDNTHAVDFWEALGFRPHRTLFRKTLERP